MKNNRNHGFNTVDSKEYIKDAIHTEILNKKIKKAGTCLVFCEDFLENTETNKINYIYNEMKSISEFYLKHPTNCSSLFLKYYKCLSLKEVKDIYVKINKYLKNKPGSFIINKNVDGFTKLAKVPTVEINGNVLTSTCNLCKTTYKTHAVLMKCSCDGYYHPNIDFFIETWTDTKKNLVYHMLRRVENCCVIGYNSHDEIINWIMQVTLKHGGSVSQMSTKAFNKMIQRD